MTDHPTMDDYLDGDEPDPPEPEPLPDDYNPYTCDHCGRSFHEYGVRASKVLRKHERRCEGDE